jgi:hypothetical protein
MRDDIAFSEVIDKLAQGWQIKGVSPPLVFGEGFYEALVKLRNRALAAPEPPPKSGQQVQLVLNCPLRIAAIHQRPRERPKMQLQGIT